MWCYKYGMDCFFTGESCNYCPYEIHRFNYECPNCKGKFIQPFYKYISKIIETTQYAYWGYVCPFCNKELEGLK